MMSTPGAEHMSVYFRLYFYILHSFILLFEVYKVYGSTHFRGILRLNFTTALVFGIEMVAGQNSQSVLLCLKGKIFM